MDAAASPKILDVGGKHEVSYCIPNWLRDEQIRLNLGNQKFPGRIQPNDNVDRKSTRLNSSH